jgi:isoleucyl-tRNA synthetase
LAIRESARKFALAAVEAQSAEFQSWGVTGDWSNPYLTLSPDYVKREMRFFGSLLRKGLIYRRYMPVYWSPWSGTALAESELEYEPAHKSTAVFVRMRLEDAGAQALLPDSMGKKVYLLVWTTTPWTLAANRAVCCSAKSKYVLVEHKNDIYVVAADLLNSTEVKEIFGNATVFSEVSGHQLVGLRYLHPLSEAAGLPVLDGAHVTVEAGSGLVHTAPAHGPDDYLVGVKHGLDLSCAVDEKGCFTRRV